MYLDLQQLRCSRWKRRRWRGPLVEVSPVPHDAVDQADPVGLQLDHGGLHLWLLCRLNWYTRYSLQLPSDSSSRELIAEPPQIINYLDPASLLSLTLVSRPLRAMLVGTTALAVWKAARAREGLSSAMESWSAGGAMGEVALANLVWGRRCKVSSGPAFHLRRRGLNLRAHRTCRRPAIARLRERRTSSFASVSVQLAGRPSQSQVSSHPTSTCSPPAFPCSALSLPSLPLPGSSLKDPTNQILRSSTYLRARSDTLHAIVSRALPLHPASNAS